MSLKLGQVQDEVSFQDGPGHVDRIQQRPGDGDLSKPALSQVDERNPQLGADLTEAGGQKLVTPAEVDVIPDGHVHIPLQDDSQNFPEKGRVRANSPLRRSMRGEVIDLDKELCSRR